MMIIIILLILLYLYKTGDLEQIGSKIRGNHHQDSEAKKLIDLRLAKGEISVEEYMKLKSVL